MPGISFYCGSKFALEGISEALGKEVARSAFRGPVRKRVESGCDAVMDPIRSARQAKCGNQPGDPEKAAQVLLQLVEAENPPVRLFLGGNALGIVEQKLMQMKTEIATWETVSRSTDFTG